MSYESSLIEEEYKKVDFLENLSNEISKNFNLDKLEIQDIIFNFFLKNNNPIDYDKLPENDA